MKIILPKNYLSWSSYSLWKRNKDQFIDLYFKNGKPLETKYLHFGKLIADAIETGTIKEILPDLIIYQHVEFKIEANIQGVPILSFIDSYNSEENIFREYKTGKNPWSLSKVQKHGQLLFYAVALRATTGTMPKYCHLDWIQTELEESFDLWSHLNPQVKTTGQIQSFKREFDERELDNLEADIVKVAQEITEEYIKFIETI